MRNGAGLQASRNRTAAASSPESSRTRTIIPVGRSVAIGRRSLVKETPSSVARRASQTGRLRYEPWSPEHRPRFIRSLPAAPAVGFGRSEFVRALVPSGRQIFRAVGQSSSKSLRWLSAFCLTFALLVALLLAVRSCRRFCCARAQVDSFLALSMLRRADLVPLGVPVHD